MPHWRQGCFLAGLLVLVIADVGPIRSQSNDKLAVHMVEHLLIADGAALLLVLGLTGPVMAPILRLPGMGGLRALAHPAVALPVWAINLYVWHIPALYEGAVRHTGFHALEHFCFLFFSVNMWMALLGPLPKPEWFGNFGRLAYIVVARLTGAILGNVFLWSGHVFYGGVYPKLSDQSLAGGVMMVEESLLTISLFAWLFFRTARQMEERDALVDLATAHGIELDPRRAMRAVSAGRADFLRTRLVEPGRDAIDPAELTLELSGEREQPRL